MPLVPLVPRAVELDVEVWREMDLFDELEDPLQLGGYEQPSRARRARIMRDPGIMCCLEITSNMDCAAAAAVHVAFLMLQRQYPLYVAVIPYEFYGFLFIAWVSGLPRMGKSAGVDSAPLPAAGCKSQQRRAAYSEILRERWDFEPRVNYATVFTGVAVLNTLAMMSELQIADAAGRPWLQTIIPCALAACAALATRPLLQRAHRAVRPGPPPGARGQAARSSVAGLQAQKKLSRAVADGARMLEVIAIALLVEDRAPKAKTLRMTAILMAALALCGLEKIRRRLQAPPILPKAHANRALEIRAHIPKWQPRDSRPSRVLGCLLTYGVTWMLTNRLIVVSNGATKYSSHQQPQIVQWYLRFAVGITALAFLNFAKLALPEYTEAPLNRTGGGIDQHVKSQIERARVLLKSTGGRDMVEYCRASRLQLRQINAPDWTRLHLEYFDVAMRVAARYCDKLGDLPAAKPRDTTFAEWSISALAEIGVECCVQFDGSNFWQWLEATDAGLAIFEWRVLAAPKPCKVPLLTSRGHAGLLRIRDNAVRHSWHEIKLLKNLPEKEKSNWCARIAPALDNSGAWALAGASKLALIGLPVAAAAAVAARSDLPRFSILFALAALAFTKAAKNASANAKCAANGPANSNLTCRPPRDLTAALRMIDIDQTRHLTGGAPGEFALAAHHARGDLSGAVGEIRATLPDTNFGDSDRSKQAVAQLERSVQAQTTGQPLHDLSTLGLVELGAFAKPNFDVIGRQAAQATRESPAGHSQKFFDRVALENVLQLVRHWRGRSVWESQSAEYARKMGRATSCEITCRLVQSDGGPNADLPLFKSATTGRIAPLTTDQQVALISGVIAECTRACLGAPGPGEIAKIARAADMVQKTLARGLKFSMSSDVDQLASALCALFSDGADMARVCHGVANAMAKLAALWEAPPLASIALDAPVEAAAWAIGAKIKYARWRRKPPHQFDRLFLGLVQPLKGAPLREMARTEYMAQIAYK